MLEGMEKSWRLFFRVIQGYTLGCNGWFDVTFRRGGGHGGWPTSWMYGCPVRLLGFLWARSNLLIKCKRAASLSLDRASPPERGGGPSQSRCNRPRPANNNEIHKSGRGQGTFEVLVDLPCKPCELLFFLLFLFLFLRIYSLLRV